MKKESYLWIQKKIAKSLNQADISLGEGAIDKDKWSNKGYRKNKWYKIKKYR